jgi:hypothetical protein
MKRKNVFKTANIRYLKLMKAYWCIPEFASLHPGERAGAGRTGGRVRSPHPLPAPHLGSAKGHFKPFLFTNFNVFSKKIYLALLLRKQL